MISAVEHKVDASTSIKARVDNLGATDFVVSGRINPTLEASFHTGCNLSGFFHGKTHDEAYSGVNFKFVLWRHKKKLSIKRMIRDFFINLYLKRYYHYILIS